jgi:hypothetical protein
MFDKDDEESALKEKLSPPSRKYFKFFRKLEPHELGVGRKSRVFSLAQANRSAEQYECRRCKARFNYTNWSSTHFRRHLINVSY